MIEMKETLGKILGTILFAVLISGLIYLVLFRSKEENKKKIRMIEVVGNHLLPAKDYLSYVGLKDSSDYRNITLPEIKERFQRHPYVKQVELEYEGNHVVKVYVSEKNITAILLVSGEPKLISDDFQLLPVLKDIKILDLPVISNAELNKQPALLSYIKTNGILEALKIIDAAKLTNKNIFKRLSDINLRNGGDIVLTFSGVKPPVIFGRSEVAKKMVYLDVMWNKIIAGNDIAENSDYIDLRFSNEIYVGTIEKTGIN